MFTVLRWPISFTRGFMHLHIPIKAFIPRGKQHYITMMQGWINQAAFSESMEMLQSWSQFSLCLCLHGCFRRRGLNYAEHLTANMMFVAFSNLVFTLIIFPLSGLSGTNKTYFFTMITMLLQAVYFALGLNGFLQLTTRSQRINLFWWPCWLFSFGQFFLLL